MNLKALGETVLGGEVGSHAFEHGAFEDKKLVGWSVGWLVCPLNELNYKTAAYQKYRNLSFQLRYSCSSIPFFLFCFLLSTFSYC